MPSSRSKNPAYLSMMTNHLQVTQELDNQPKTSRKNVKSTKKSRMSMERASKEQIEAEFMHVLSGCDSSDAGSHDDNVRIKTKNLS